MEHGSIDDMRAQAIFPYSLHMCTLDYHTFYILKECPLAGLQGCPHHQKIFHSSDPLSMVVIAAGWVRLDPSRRCSLSRLLVLSQVRLVWSLRWP
jgi:hypothetical protein